MNLLTRSIAALVVALTLIAGATPALARVYRGNVYSDYGSVVQLRAVLHPTGPTYAGVVYCRSFNPSSYCLAPSYSIQLDFFPDVNAPFSQSMPFQATLDGGACWAAGTARFNGPLAGNYGCVDGDTGTFYLRRVR